jgi:hypothetical protein
MKLLGTVQAETVSPSEATAAATPQQAQKLLAGLPLYFIPNQGQADARVKYYLPGHDTQVYFTATGLTLRLSGAGMRWGEAGADAVCRLRALFLSDPGPWEAFWHHN